VTTMCELCCDNHGWDGVWSKRVAANKGCCRDVCHCSGCSVEHIERNWAALRGHNMSTINAAAKGAGADAVGSWCPRLD
jgi:hypothetical protein